MDGLMDECHGCIEPCIARGLVFVLFILLESGNQSIDNSEFWTGEREKEREGGRDDTILERHDTY